MFLRTPGNLGGEIAARQALADDFVLRRRFGWVLLREGLVFALVPAAIYAGSFAVHFALLDRSGPTDKWMSTKFQSTLQGNPAYVSGARAPFLQSFVELNRTMGAINAAWATDTNNGASPWYSWPIAKRSMGFWSPTRRGQEPERWIVLSANPIVWWGALFGMLAVALAAIQRRRELEQCRMALLFLASGYALNFLPFAFIRRPMYLYHYFFALIFSTMIAALGVGALAGWTASGDARPWSVTRRRSALLYFGILSLAAGTFAYLAPMFAVTYGALFLDEAISVGTVGGLILILTGSYAAVEGRPPWQRRPLPALVDGESPA